MDKDAMWVWSWLSTHFGNDELLKLGSELQSRFGIEYKDGDWRSLSPLVEANVSAYQWVQQVVCAHRNMWQMDRYDTAFTDAFQRSQAQRQEALKQFDLQLAWLSSWPSHHPLWVEIRCTHSVAHKKQALIKNETRSIAAVHLVSCDFRHTYRVGMTRLTQDYFAIGVQPVKDIPLQAVSACVLVSAYRFLTRSDAEADAMLQKSGGSAVRLFTLSTKSKIHLSFNCGSDFNDPNHFALFWSKSSVNDLATVHMSHELLVASRDANAIDHPLWSQIILPHLSHIPPLASLILSFLCFQN